MSKSRSSVVDSVPQSLNSKLTASENVEGLTDDLRKILLDVENLSKSKTIFETAQEDLKDMLKEVGSISRSLSRRNSFDDRSDTIAATLSAHNQRSSQYLSVEGSSSDETTKFGIRHFIKEEEPESTLVK